MIMIASLHNTVDQSCTGQNSLSLFGIGKCCKNYNVKKVRKNIKWLKVKDYPIQFIIVIVLQKSFQRN